jgi:hypothetical protein
MGYVWPIPMAYARVTLHLDTPPNLIFELDKD